MLVPPSEARGYVRKGAGSHAGSFLALLRLHASGAVDVIKAPHLPGLGRQEERKYE